MKIAFIGGGNMATAMLGGLLQQGYQAVDIGVLEVVAEARVRLVEQFKVQAFATPTAELLAAPLIVFAVKPQQLADVARSVVPPFEVTRARNTAALSPLPCANFAAPLNV